MQGLRHHHHQNCRQRTFNKRQGHNFDLKDNIMDNSEAIISTWPLNCGFFLLLLLLLIFLLLLLLLLKYYISLSSIGMHFVLPLSSDCTIAPFFVKKCYEGLDLQLKTNVGQAEAFISCSTLMWSWIHLATRRHAVAMMMTTTTMTVIYATAYLFTLLMNIC